MNTSLRHNGKEYRKGAPFRVGMIVEMYVERTIRALDAKQAAEIAINRQQAKTATLQRNGYTVGDIEIMNAEEVK
jgi:hypothetical protein